jgi:hypothetical protein
MRRAGMLSPLWGLNSVSQLRVCAKSFSGIYPENPAEIRKSENFGRKGDVAAGSLGVIKALSVIIVRPFRG